MAEDGNNLARVLQGTSPGVKGERDSEKGRETPRMKEDRGKGPKGKNPGTRKDWKRPRNRKTPDARNDPDKMAVGKTPTIKEDWGRAPQVKSPGVKEDMDRVQEGKTPSLKEDCRQGPQVKSPGVTENHWDRKPAGKSTLGIREDRGIVPEGKSPGGWKDWKRPRNWKSHDVRQDRVREPVEKTPKMKGHWGKVPKGKSPGVREDLDEPRQGGDDGAKLKDNDVDGKTTHFEDPTKGGLAKKKRKNKNSRRKRKEATVDLPRDIDDEATIIDMFNESNWRCTAANYRDWCSKAAKQKHFKWPLNRTTPNANSSSLTSPTLTLNSTTLCGQNSSMQGSQGEPDGVDTGNDCPWKGMDLATRRASRFSHEDELKDMERIKEERKRTADMMGERKPDNGGTCGPEMCRLKESQNVTLLFDTPAARYENLLAAYERLNAIHFADQQLIAAVFLHHRQQTLASVATVQDSGWISPTKSLKAPVENIPTEGLAM